MAKLADIAIVLTGVSPQADGDALARFVQIKDLTSESRSLAYGPRPTVKRALPIEDGDVLVASRGERGLAVKATPDMVGAFASLDVYLVRPDAECVDTDYLVSFLNLPDVASSLRAAASGGSLPRIPKETLRDLEIPLPPMHRQAAIGWLCATMEHYQHLGLKRVAAENKLFKTCLQQIFAEIH
jgi:hypothetical protein